MGIFNYGKSKRSTAKNRGNGSCQATTSRDQLRSILMGLRCDSSPCGHARAGQALAGTVRG